MINLLSLIVIMKLNLLLGDIGSIVEAKESNNNVYAVSNIKGDKGGKSYGLYQFSSNYGIYSKWLKTLPIDIKTNIDNKGYVKGIEPYYNYIKLSQRLFAYRNYLLPAIKKYPIKGISELKIVYSIVINHGRAYKILDKYYSNSNNTIKDLVDIRIEYVLSLGLDSNIKRVLVKRYKQELKLIINY